MSGRKHGKTWRKGAPGRKSKYRRLEVGTSLEHLRISYKARMLDRIREVGKPVRHVMG